MKNIRYLIFITFLVLSCSHYGTFVNSRYENYKPSNSKLLIVLKDSIQLNYEGRVKEEFGEGDSLDLIIRYILAQLAGRIEKEGHFSSVRFHLWDEYIPFKKVTLPCFGKNSMEIDLPLFEKSEKYKDVKAPYLLILNDFSIISDFKITIGSAGPIRIGLPSKSLIFDSKFLYWDNTAGDVICWGRSTAGDTTNYAITKREWRKVCSLFSEKILVQTPFGSESKRSTKRDVSIFK